MYDFYYASGWFSEEQCANYELLTKKLKTKFSIFEPRYKAGEAAPNETLTLARAKEIFKADINGIHNCKAVFADISFRDTGVLVEIGAALERGIPVILFDNSDRPKMNVMLADRKSVV